MPEFDNYQSPFSWRYGSPEMRRIWGEVYKRRLWRRIWLALAEVEHEYGLVTADQLTDLRSHFEEVHIERSLEIEAEIQHDLMAEMRAFAEQAPLGGGILHLGATSADIEDNADALRMQEALEIIRDRLRSLLSSMADQIDRWADQPVMAFTHLQPAEPSTLGYRLAVYAQDWLTSFDDLTHLEIRGKGFKGAVGTGAAFTQLIGVERFEEFEARLSQKLGIGFFPVSGQTYPRSQDYRIVAGLAGLAAGIYKFAFDLRLLQSPIFDEMAEPFGKTQVGSSAMPFKRNPIQSEKIDSLGRVLAGFPRLAWDDAAHSLLERTLDDSANRRILLPESFLTCDEMLRTATRIVENLQVNLRGIQRNLDRFADFAAIEPILMALTQAGGDRQKLHERLRQLAMQAWAAIQNGQPNPLKELVAADPELNVLLPAQQIMHIFTAQLPVGIAPLRARQMAREIRDRISKNANRL